MSRDERRRVGFRSYGSLVVGSHYMLFGCLFVVVYLCHQTGLNMSHVTHRPLLPSFLLYSRLALDHKPNYSKGVLLLQRLYICISLCGPVFHSQLWAIEDL